MSEPQAAPRKPPFLQTFRRSMGPYKRLFSYVKPYKWRFILGLVFGFGFGAITGMMPLVRANVMGTVFHGGGAATPQQFAQNPGLENAGGSCRISVTRRSCHADPTVLPVSRSLSR